MDIFFTRLLELKGSQSTSAFARSIGIPQPSMDRYLKGRYPTIEVVRLLCSVYQVSSDWLLGLNAQSPGNVTAMGQNATVASGNATVTIGGNCSKCKLMQAHILEITGR